MVKINGIELYEPLPVADARLYGPQQLGSTSDIAEACDAFLSERWGPKKTVRQREREKLQKRIGEVDGR